MLSVCSKFRSYSHTKMPIRTSKHFFRIYCALAAFLLIITIIWHQSSNENFMTPTKTQQKGSHEIHMTHRTSKPPRMLMTANSQQEAQSQDSLKSGNCSKHPCEPDQTQDSNNATSRKHNALEDAMLQAYLLAEENNLKIKGVITLLAYLPRYDTLHKSLKSIFENFNHHFAYPVVIFHEADFLPKIKDLRQVGANKQRKMNSIFFQQIELSVPDWQIRKFGHPPKEVCGPANRLGYRSMCRFQAKLIYEQPIMQHFDYHWRLDDDSLITAKISFDVFAFLIHSGFTYGYYETNIDICAGSIYRRTADYIRSRKILPTFFNWLKKDEIFFNNFEVSSMNLWRSKQYRDYVDYIDSLGGFYSERWGDAPVKTLFLSMFVPVREIYRFSNVNYTHHSVPSIYSTKFLS